MTGNSTARKFGSAVLAIVPVAATLIAGQIATFPNLKPWYSALAKPSFNPPNWLFGPVWTLLYVLMAYAVWRVLRLPASPRRRMALTLFFVQLALNAAWSWMFFMAHNPALGLLDIVPQWIAIVATIVVFASLDSVASWCLVPLAAWVGFATALNFAIWRFNP
jgi:tryptophan-rich sensory protein